MITTLLAGALLALQTAPTPPVPPPPPAAPEPGKPGETKRFILIRDDAQGAPAPKPGERREIVVVRQVGPDGKASEERTDSLITGPGELRAHVLECDSSRKFETEAQGSAKDGETQKTRIVICGKGQETDARWAQTLRDSVKRIEGNERMPADVKVRVIAALNDAIARLPVSQ